MALKRTVIEFCAAQVSTLALFQGFSPRVLIYGDNSFFTRLGYVFQSYHLFMSYLSYLNLTSFLCERLIAA